jgi:putative phosphoribosyl transferase
MLENDPASSDKIQQPGQIISVKAGVVTRDAILTLPGSAQGIIVLAADTPLVHRQNIALASAFHNQGLGSLLIDLFSSEELQLDAESGYFRENTDIMQQRLIGSAESLQERPETQHYSIGYFGLGIIGAVSLIAATQRPDLVAAVVAESSKLDALEQADPQEITAAILLFAPTEDSTSTQNGQKFLERLNVEKQFAALEGPLFTDNRPLPEMLNQASAWFEKHLTWIM